MYRNIPSFASYFKFGILKFLLSTAAAEMFFFKLQLYFSLQIKQKLNWPVLCLSHTHTHARTHTHGCWLLSGNTDEKAPRGLEVRAIDRLMCE